MGTSIIAKLKNKINQITDIDNRLQKEGKFIPSPTLQFEVHLTEHCNLNCKGCDNFSCIAEPAFLDIKQYEKDLARLSEMCEGEVKRIYLMGGEPCLHPDVSSIALLTREYFPYGAIDVYTNGLLLSKQNEKFWRDLKEANVGIMVTPYPISFDYADLEQYVKEKGVKFQYCMSPEVEKGLFHFTLDLEGQQNEVESFLQCHRANTCIQLKNGKLYTCSIVANIEHFNKQFNEALPVTSRNYIDIYEAKSLQEILDFLARPIPFCRFCKINADTQIYPWQKTRKEKSEWI